MESHQTENQANMVGLSNGAPAGESSRSEGVRSPKTLILAGVALVVILAVFIEGVVYLLQPSTPTAKIRDVLIIFMALASLLLVVAMLILLAQLARLINLLENEIKPILESTSESLDTLRGTTTFLSDHFVEPVIKINSYLGTLRPVIQVSKMVGKKSRNGGS